MPPKINKTGTMVNRKTPNSGWLWDILEKILKITRAIINAKTAPAALVIRSLNISLSIFKIASLQSHSALTYTLFAEG